MLGYWLKLKGPAHGVQRETTQTIFSCRQASVTTCIWRKSALLNAQLSPKANV